MTIGINEQINKAVYTPPQHGWVGRGSAAKKTLTFQKSYQPTDGPKRKVEKT